MDEIPLDNESDEEEEEEEEVFALVRSLRIDWFGAVETETEPSSCKAVGI